MTRRCQSGGNDNTNHREEMYQFPGATPTQTSSTGGSSTNKRERDPRTLPGWLENTG